MKQPTQKEAMMNPKVTFIVPCYKLAHFLSDCVNSILSQSYRDFELFIMDDCSPDNTPEVAAKCKDPRVTYLRHEKNIGNIPNYNKGIELARGEYIWLISADDCLRSQHVLQRYVDLLDRNPQIGYVFCPAMIIRDGKEIGVEACTIWPGDRDRILRGAEVVKRSTIECPVSSPTGLVRKECYERVGGGFPLSLPRTGDYYLWTVFATMYDVGYFAEPMVCYRRHTSNMDKTIEIELPSMYYEEDLRVRWLIKNQTQAAKIQDASSGFCRNLAQAYLWRIIRSEVEGWQHGIPFDIAIQEIHTNANSNEEAEEILRLIASALPSALAVAYCKAGIESYHAEKLDRAVAAFRSALKSNPWHLKSRIYLGCSRLERSLGIRFVPWLRWLRTTYFG